jgi:hypothetical protein
MSIAGLRTVAMTHIGRSHRMKQRFAVLMVAFIALAGLVCATTPDEDAAAIAAGNVPSGYRDWRLISVAREEGNVDDIRAILGNDVAIQAYRQAKPPFPDGTIIARVAWTYLPSEENNKIFGKKQSFVAGPPKNGVQFMVKDSKKYASTGGWMFAQFDDANRSTRRCSRAAMTAMRRSAIAIWSLPAMRLKP